MKKLNLLTLIICSITGFGQTHEHENHFPCGVNQQLDQIYSDNPILKTQDSIDGVHFEEQYQQYLLEYDPSARSSYVIPVVFHVVHMGGQENISDEQIFDALEKLNEDYNMLNSDLSTVVSSFTHLIGNPDVEFRLATKDPNQNCHSGITRTNSQYTVDDGSGATRNAVAAVHGVWPQNRYLNIFVVSDPNGNAGYTNYPSNSFNPTSMQGAIYLRHDYCGTIGTGSTSRRRTISHECAHWLNIRHTWGNSNNANDPGNCSLDDLVADTPNTLGNTSCDLTMVTCGSLDNVQNIMDYTGSCRRMFTQGQAARMHTALNSSTAQRNNLWTAGNLAFTGTDGSGDLCEVNFSSDIQVICAGQSIEFYDNSYHQVTSRTWTFTGGSPNTESVENPIITYNTPGIYSVELEATDGSNTLTKTKSNYIVVLEDNGESLPYFEGFESLTSVPDAENWFVLNENELEEWSLSNVGATGSSKSARLFNYGNTDESIDELISGTIDLSGLNPSANLILNFDFAYRKLLSSDNEKLQIFISKDCGETWVLRKNIGGNALSSIALSNAYTPASDDDWSSVEITNINSDYYVSNFRFKFVFTNDGGNNIYIDNINLYDESTSDIEAYTTGSKILLSPNPAYDYSTLRMFNVEKGQYDIDVISIDGKVKSKLYSGTIETEDFKVDLNTANFSKGLYLVRIQGNNFQQNIKLIKE